MLEDNDGDNGDDATEVVKTQVVKTRGMVLIAVCGRVCIAYACVCNLALRFSCGS